MCVEFERKTLTHSKVLTPLVPGYMYLLVCEGVNHCNGNDQEGSIELNSDLDLTSRILVLIELWPPWTFLEPKQWSVSRVKVGITTTNLF